jgi:hypothetical protein
MRQKGRVPDAAEEGGPLMRQKGEGPGSSRRGTAPDLAEGGRPRI